MRCESSHNHQLMLKKCASLILICPHLASCFSQNKSLQMLSYVINKNSLPCFIHREPKKRTDFPTQLYLLRAFNSRYREPKNNRHNYFCYARLTADGTASLAAFPSTLCHFATWFAARPRENSSAATLCYLGSLMQQSTACFDAFCLLRRRRNISCNGVSSSLLVSSAILFIQIWRARQRRP